MITALKLMKQMIDRGVIKIPTGESGLKGEPQAIQKKLAEANRQLELAMQTIEAQCEIIRELSEKS